MTPDWRAPDGESNRLEPSSPINRLEFLVLHLRHRKLFSEIRGGRVVRPDEWTFPSHYGYSYDTNTDIIGSYFRGTGNPSLRSDLQWTIRVPIFGFNPQSLRWTLGGSTQDSRVSVVPERD